MANTSPVEQRFARLKELRADPRTDESRRYLVECLGHKVNLVVSRAAAIVGEFAIGELSAALVAAFQRFMTEAASEDRTYDARTAVAKALLELGAREHELYLAGLRCNQGARLPRDSASDLRSVCAIALARTGYRHALWELAGALEDSIPQCRIAAARAIAETGQDDGAALLRHKVLTGDTDPDVTAECLAALASLQPRLTLPFIARRFDVDDEATREAAILAFGSSRDPLALELLSKALDREVRAASRRLMLLAIALPRTQAGIDHLVGLIQRGPVTAAVDAIKALATYRQDGAIRARAAAAVTARAEAKVTSAFEAEFRGNGGCGGTA